MLAAVTACACALAAAWYVAGTPERQAERASLAELERRSQDERPPEPAQYFLGRRLIEAGRLPEAYAAFLRAAREHPGSRRCRLGAIEALVASRRWDEAAERLDRLPASAALAPDAALLRARLLLEGRSRPDEMLSFTADLARRHPRLAELQYLRGQAHAALYQPEQSLAAFRRAAELRPDDFRYRRETAQSFLYFGRVQEAVGELRAALALAPEDATTLYLLGASLSMVAQGPEEESQARGALTRAASLRPGDPEIQCQLGQLAQNGRQFAEAAARYARCLELDPSHADAVYRLAQCRFRMGQEASGERLMAAYSRLRALTPPPPRGAPPSLGELAPDGWRRLAGIYRAGGFGDLARAAAARVPGEVPPAAAGEPPP